MKLPLWRRRRDADLDDEIAAHFRMAVDDRVERGQSREDAERAARIEFGNIVRVKEEIRDAWGLRTVAEFGSDLRYACRTLLKSPGFTAAAVLTLALGIGAATLMFSIVYGVFLRPLPILEPERVVVIGGHPYAEYRDLQRRNSTFDGLAAFRQVSMGLDTGTNPARETPFIVTGNYFEVLGVRPLLGRLLRPDDDRDEAEAVMVLSYDLWTAAYHADPSVVGTTVRLVATRALSASGGVIGEKAYTVVGVAPKGFYGTDISIRPPAWIPLHAFLPESRLASRQTPGFAGTVFGRLKNGISREAAQTDLSSIADELAREYPTTDAGYRVSVVDLGSRLHIPGVRAFASAMLYLAALVLFAACASVATGLTARTIDRHRELGIRISLGAGRLRVVRLVLIEALVIVGISGPIALGMVWWTTHALSQMSIPALGLPVQVDVHPDTRVFLMATVVSILASLVAVIAPGRTIATLDPNLLLKGIPGSVAGRRWAAQDLLTVAQVAFSCVLMAACVLSLVSMRRALAVPLGFDAGRVAAVTLDFDIAKYTPEQQRLFMVRAAEEVRRLPEVETVAYAIDLPLTGGSTFRFAIPEGRPPSGQQATRVALYSVTEDYLRTMGIRRVAGRDLDARDTSKALVNETFVRQILQLAPVIGTRVTFADARGGALPGPQTSIEIVGVVADGKYASLTESSQAAMFTPFFDRPFGRPTMVVRVSGSPASMAATVHRAIATLDPRLPVVNVGSLEQLTAPAFLPSQAAAITLTAFGVVALLLATTGIHGAVNYAVSRRRWGIALRVALGASRARVISLVLGRIAVVIGLGIALGVVATAALGRVLSQVVYLASSNEPTLLGGVIVVMLLAAAGALVGPTVRSLRIEPMTALRSE